MNEWMDTMLLVNINFPYHFLPDSYYSWQLRRYCFHTRPGLKTLQCDTNIMGNSVFILSLYWMHLIFSMEREREEAREKEKDWEREREDIIHVNFWMEGVDNSCGNEFVYHQNFIRSSFYFFRLYTNGRLRMCICVERPTWSL